MIYQLIAIDFSYLLIIECQQTNNSLSLSQRTSNIVKTSLGTIRRLIIGRLSLSSLKKFTLFSRKVVFQCCSPNTARNTFNNAKE